MRWDSKDTLVNVLGILHSEHASGRRECILGDIVESLGFEGKLKKKSKLVLTLTHAELLTLAQKKSSAS